MDDKAIASRIRRLTKELSKTVEEAVEVNGLQVKISSFPIRRIGTKHEVYFIESRIYKEVI